ncbi:MAG: LysR family transcriptional regulator [Xanthomonadaceae bacterium]|jgi:DNA-binding transcriptional LysR family regulator|nr:LysR family transcriptional regulator [Xanthomonadaceae bacterium]
MRRELPPLNALRAFESAARLGGVSRAAEELHVTHGAISRQIRTLEEWFGVALFARQGRGLTLTPAGQRLQEATSTAFEHLRLSSAELRRVPRQGPLVLGCPGSLLARWIIPRLARLEQQLPELCLHLAVSEQVPDAQLSGLDAALLIAAPPWPETWQVHELAQERIGPVLSPRFGDFGTLRHAPVQALLEQPLLHTQSRPQAWPDWAHAQGLDADALHYGGGFEHLSYLLEAAVAGLGVAITPEPLVSEDLAARRLVAPWGFSATPSRWVLCAPQRHADPRIEALGQWLRRELTATAFHA